MNADVPAMLSALPAGTMAYELHIAGLNRWIASIGRGAILSSKVIQVANITLIAISIYQVWKLPAIPAGGSPTPPTILGTLPGGVAVGSGVSLPSLARALEAIRRLVAIGALDGALIGGIGSLGGGPSIALPELQRPTSLSVQAPTASPGATPSPGDKGKQIAYLIKEAQKEFPNKAGKIQLHHEHPIYLRGPKNGRTVPIDAAYHQKITNEFRKRIPYGKQNEFSDAQIDKVMKEVYEQFPLPE